MGRKNLNSGKIEFKGSRAIKICSAHFMDSYGRREGVRVFPSTFSPFKEGKEGGVCDRMNGYKIPTHSVINRFTKWWYFFFYIFSFLLLSPVLDMLYNLEHLLSLIATFCSLSVVILITYFKKLLCFSLNFFEQQFTLPNRCETKNN